MVTGRKDRKIQLVDKDTKLIRKIPSRLGDWGAWPPLTSRGRSNCDLARLEKKVLSIVDQFFSSNQLFSIEHRNHSSIKVGEFRTDPRWLRKKYLYLYLSVAILF